MISQNSQQHKETVIIIMHRLAIPDSPLGSSYQKSKNGGKINVPPGGICMPARRFLGRTQNFQKTASDREENSYIYTWQHKTNRSQL